MKSEVAIVASIIRAELKKNGIKCSVTSSRFSMGNAVRVHIYDQPPAAVKKIEEFCSQYESGHFDGMTDCYNYDHTKTGPTAKYIQVQNDISDDLRSRAREFVAARFGLLNEFDMRDTMHGVLYRLDCISEDFWRQLKPRVRLAA